MSSACLIRSNFHQRCTECNVMITKGSTNFWMSLTLETLFDVLKLLARHFYRIIIKNKRYWKWDDYRWGLGSLYLRWFLHGICRHESPWRSCLPSPFCMRPVSRHSFCVCTGISNLNFCLFTAPPSFLAFVVLV